MRYESVALGGRCTLKWEEASQVGRGVAHDGRCVLQGIKDLAKDIMYLNSIKNVVMTYL